MAIVTSLPKGRAEAMLSIVGFSGAFDCVVAYGDTAKRKPHPEPILLACHRLDCRAAEAIALGDMERDITAARSAGCLAVGVAWGVDPPEVLRRAGADKVIERPGELLALVRG